MATRGIMTRNMGAAYESALPAYPDALAANEVFIEDLLFIQTKLSASNMQLANAVGVSKRCIKYWKCGQKNPNIGAYTLVLGWAARLRASN